MQSLTHSLLKTATACLVFTSLIPASLHAGTTNMVHFGSFYFRPNTLIIQPGDTVIWQNDGGTHTVTGRGSDPVCGAGTIPSTCSHVFNAPGTYPYVCNIAGHAALGMTGVVHVVQTTIASPVLTNATRLTDGTLQFTVLTTAGRTNLIQATTNVANPNSWVLIDKIVPTTGSFQFTDPQAGQFNFRLYRVGQ